MTNTNDNLDEVESILAKHFPDESPHELLGRMQSLLTFVGKIDPKILAYSSKTHVAQAPEKQHISGHSPAILHQFNQTTKKNNHPSLSSAPKLEEEVRSVLLGQILKLQEINHLEPSQRTSATRRMKQ